MPLPQFDEPIIEIRDLRKVYGNHQRPVIALDGVNLTIYRGEVMALLGPNGAGKTTTIGILTTRIKPTSGWARVAAIDPVENPIELKKIIAVVPQQMNLDRSLRVRENLLFHAEYFGIPKAVREDRADRLLDWLHLRERARDKIDHLSGGMRQRLMIARALMHEPQILFLDEATLGLDPPSRLLIWDKIRELREQGLTIILTTHYMDEAEELSTRVAIIDHGRILALNTSGELKRLLPGGEVIELEFRQAPADILDRLRGVDGLARAEREGQRVRLYVGSAGPTLPRVMQVLDRQLDQLLHVHLSPATLEDVFIYLTGRGLRE
ncbi:MAG: ABC transporter ATP-binding protein [Acidobacteria bacterium]|nr:ABC transporter ATP-binding protein [Acidobacteriota bacterium]